MASAGINQVPPAELKIMPFSSRRRRCAWVNLNSKGGVDLKITLQCRLTDINFYGILLYPYIYRSKGEQSKIRILVFSFGLKAILLVGTAPIDYCYQMAVPADHQ